MDKIEKILRKLTKKERDFLYKKIFDLQSKKVDNLNIIKIKNSDFFRLRAGNFRIIFYYKDKKFILIDIKIRNDNTYKNIKE